MPGMTDRDTFAAAALTGLLFHNHEPPKPALWWVEQAFDYADAMLRERERRERREPKTLNSGEYGPEWHAAVPNLDAAPAARASVDSVATQPTTRGESDRTDKAAPRPSEGTGDTQEPVAWGVASHKGLLYATAISRIDAVDMQSDYACDTEIVPLYRHPPVTKPMPKEKRAEVSDRSKPITGPDPDSRVWETHTPATHATHGEGSEQRECTEPVAWAAIRENGQPLWLSYDRSGAEGMVNGMAEVFPLYRSPTLTDAEREAIEFAAAHGETVDAAWRYALRGLLERLR